MNSFKTMNGLFLWALGAFFCVGSLQAAFALEPVSSRDASVDSALIEDGGLSGVLPPTGSQVAAPVPAIQGTQVFEDPATPRKISNLGIVASGQIDHQAKVFRMMGDVRRAKKDSQVWDDVKVGTSIRQGDVVLTGKNSSASIAFDEKFLNAVYLPELTRAVFRSIEPTDVFVEDGTIYNVFDGLPPGSNWKVSSPVAVAAVRGTRYLVKYQAANGEYITAVLEVPEDGESSAVTLVEILPNGGEGQAVDISEGYQIELAAGQTPDPSLIEKIDPRWIQEIESFLEQLLQEREEKNGGPLLPAGGDFRDPNVLDPAGSGAVGGSPDTPIDPFIDSGLPAENPMPDNDFSSDSGSWEDEGEGEYEGPNEEGEGESESGSGEEPRYV